MQSGLKNETKTDWYDLTRLLSMKDVDGNPPEWFFVSGNKGGGKTTTVIHFLVEQYLKMKRQFMLVYRWGYELGSAAGIVESVVVPIFYTFITFRTKPIAKGLFYQIELAHIQSDVEVNDWDWQVCGYSVSLNTVDTLKKYSNYFHNVYNRYMDEFQAEREHYLKDEMALWQSLQILSSRGIGETYRYTRTIFTSNSYSLLNPYFVTFGIHKQLKKDTKFLKGKGWVLEQFFCETAASKLKGSKLLESISKKSLDYAAENVYLDDACFVEKMSGKSWYAMTIVRDGKPYGVRQFENGVVYISQKAERNSNVFSFDTKDHDEHTTMLEHNSYIYMFLKNNFCKGNIRFSDLETKDVVLDVLSL